MKNGRKGDKICIYFEEIKKEDGDILASWLEQESINKWMGGIKDWHKYFDAVKSPDYFLFKVSLDGKIIGEIGLEIIDEVGYVSFMINPDEHNKGHGKKILKLFLENISRLIGKKIKYIEAGIDADNIASKRCFESCGFELKEIDEDGFMDYIYNIEN